jgi:hypothetical protein
MSVEESEDLPEKPPSDFWFVAFAGNNVHGWWRLFTSRKPEYQHCVAYRYDTKLKIWLFVEWSKNRLKITPYTRWEFTPVIAWILENAEIWQIGSRRTKRSKYHMYFPAFWPITCVTAIQHLIGLKGIVLTPYQLRKNLQASGATLWEASNGRDIR